MHVLLLLSWPRRPLSPIYLQHLLLWLKLSIKIQSHMMLSIICVCRDLPVENHEWEKWQWHSIGLVNLITGALNRIQVRIERIDDLWVHDSTHEKDGAYKKTHICNIKRTV